MAHYNAANNICKLETVQNMQSSNGMTCNHHKGIHMSIAPSGGQRFAGWQPASSWHCVTFVKSHRDDIMQQSRTMVMRC